ncbi:MAG: EGF domain-containing protein [Myxococcota bacterium]|nr:EGF domain-containing protein [Myxococcota bacterium]
MRPLRFFAVLSVALLGTVPAYAYPDYHPGGMSAWPPSYGSLACETCHLNSGGGSGCGSGFEPCFNPFGYQYYLNASGWPGVSGSNADGDNRTNTQEIYTDSTLPGFPNGAESVSCDMETCALAANGGSMTGSVACSSNVVCTSTRHVYGSGRDRYTFSFSCAANTSGTLSLTDSNWVGDCADVNECAGNPCSPGTCSQIPLGSWTSPGYTCSCPTGYSSNGTACVIVDDCAAGTDTCVALATCSDDPGPLAYTCTCPHAGYQGDGRSPGSGCTNIDECASAPCGPNGVSCTETPLGSWSSPGYSCTCAAGYGFDGTTCVLQNECTAGTDDCVAIATCSDPTTMAGDFSCTCPAGYLGDGHAGGSGCTDIDECAMGADDCHADATCTNTPGSFSCACNSGYSGDGRSCSDIDECADPIFVAMCDANASCNNLVGSFECNCDAGYSGDGFSCADIDECATGADDCHADATCSNSPGSFSCACNTGYMGDGRSCSDIDECADPALGGACSTASTCTNLPGDWECTCNGGFRGDGFSCEDIDECAEGTDGCDANAVCVNSIGSYSCMCADGFEGSGFSCTDVDECADGTGGCGPGEMCVNQYGMPNTCVCAVGYTADPMTGECVVACGDAVRGPAEECDDGNTDAGDGCSERCDVEEGWRCVEPEGTQSVCTNSCGNGLVDVAEECDDGAGNSDTAVDGCRTDCSRAYCGDGVTDSGEECDQGGDNSDLTVDGCRPDCVWSYCGDGVVDTGEVCDPGGGLPGASPAGTCTTLCRVDGGVDPSDPPVLTGGACATTHGRGGSGALWLLALGALWLRRRR